jgi:predicted aspartyl protease
MKARSLSRALPILFALAGALPLAGAASAQQAQDLQACTLQKIATLDMETRPTGEIALPVLVNNRPMDFLIDTGSRFSSITAETASELSLRTKFTAAGGAFLNNVPIYEDAKVDSFRVGPTYSNDGWKFLVVSDSLLPATIAGMIAPDFLLNYDVDFDFYRGKLSLFKHHACPGKAVYWTSDAYAQVPIKVDGDGHIFVNAILDGQQVSAALDTGSPSSAMSLDVARKLFGWDAKDPNVKLLGTENLNGGQPTQFYGYPFKSLSFEGIAVSNPQITMIPADHFIDGRSHDATVILGMSILRQLHIYVAYDEKVVYLTGAEAK